MTSDERVQIYVPSPQTTPYNTIHHHPALGAAAAAAAAASKQLEGGVSQAAPFGHIARVGILAGNDSSRSVTPIKARGVAVAAATADGDDGANSLQKAAAAAATATTSLEMVRISIRSSSSSSSSASAATTTAKAATMMEDLPSLPTDASAATGSSGPVSLSDVVLVDDAGAKRENGDRGGGGAR